MKVSVEAVVQDGKLKLEEPISYPDGTKARVTFLTDDSNQDDARKWLEQYYQRTKDLILDEEFEKNVNVASEVINSWQLPE
ncbi:MAG: hypothetical protein ACE5G1_05520 [bacterium]